MFPNIFRTFPKILEDSRRLPRKIRRCFDLISINFGSFSIESGTVDEEPLCGSATANSHYYYYYYMANLSANVTKSISSRMKDMMGVFHLHGETFCSGEKSNGTDFSTGNVSERDERNTFRGIPLFSFLPK